MGNKLCMCYNFSVKDKRKVRKPPAKSTLSPFSDLSLELEDFLEGNDIVTPINHGTPLFLCQICCQSKPLKNSFNVEGCAHFYCTKCTLKYIVSKLQCNMLYIMCPEPECSGALNPQHCKPIVPNNVLVWWENALCEAAISEKDKFYCPFNDCSALMMLVAAREGEKVVCTDAKCHHCKRSICIQCKAPWHPDMSCENFQKMKGNNDGMMLYLAKKRKWRRCPNCKYYVEKEKGCNVMDCRFVSFNASLP